MNPIKLCQFACLAIFIFTAEISRAQIAASTSTATIDTNLDQQVAAADAVYSAWDQWEQPIGPSHRTTMRRDRSGQRKIVEVATGMNYWNGQGWQPSSPVFQATTNGFTATQVQDPVSLSSDLSVNGAVTVTTPDGIVLNSTPVAVALYDASNGEFQVIASITNTVGVLADTNAVIYPDAFSGGICADIIYSITAGTFNQDVVFTGGIDPADYGFQRDTTRIQIITEFYNAPDPDVLTRPLYVEQNEAIRNQRVTPDLIDEQLGFGRFVMTTGSAYVAPAVQSTNGASALVAKEFKTINGRTYLFESVPYTAISWALTNLPPCHPAVAITKARSSNGYASIPHPGNKLSSKPLLARNNPTSTRGLVIDYVANIGGTMSGTTVFKGDTTYLVSSAVSCNGSTTIEGGAVFKYKSNTSINLNSTLTCKTGMYRPAIFTAVDDNTVGDTMNGVTNSGYTGTISSLGYANPALYSPSAMTFSGFRFLYAKQGIGVYGNNATWSVTHSQFYDCVTAISLQQGTGGSGSGSGSGGSSVNYLNVNNCLFSKVNYPISGNNLGGKVTQNITVYNSTFDQANYLAQTINSITFALTAENSIFSSITSGPGSGMTFGGNHNGFYNNGFTFTAFGTSSSTVYTSPFQMVGDGGYYLTSASGFQNAGVTNGLSASLLKDLSKRTTFPPGTVTAQTIINSDTVLSTQVERNTGTLDYGYHYDPIDYALGGVYVTNASMTISDGVTVATFSTNNGVYGLGLGVGSSFDSIGTPNNPNWIVLFNTVQEGSSTNWQKLTNSVTGELYGATPAPSISTRFTDWSVLAQDAAQFYAPTNSGPIAFQDNEFHGGKLISLQPTIDLTNNLLERVYTSLITSDGNSPYIRNNLFFGGTFNFAPGVTNSFVKDNLFDQTSIPTNTSAYITYNGGYNAFINTYNRLWPTNAADKILSTSPTYQTGTLGSYYELSSSALINAGNTTADQVGLYHYTLVTNLISNLQVKETNSVVDIGYHYVATDASGNPLDSNHNGIPDYLEDGNGDGVVDNGESSWSTNALVATNSVPAGCMGYWRFDNPPVWSDEMGLLPTNAYHVLTIPSWIGDAVKLNPAEGSVLAYPAFRTNGAPVILNQNGSGSIRFWYKPDWSSVSYNYDGTGGTGPQDTIRLLEIGHQSSDATYGWFALTINPAGTALTFGTEANGIHVDNDVYAINFNSKSWYQVVLTYTPTNSILYVNGIRQPADGVGVTNFPSQSVIQQGFNLGSSWDGIHQANGSFDELQAFNYPLSANDVATNYQAIMSIDSDGDGLPDVVENGLGSRSDAVDSDCDGLPDAWEVANGLNPANAADATPAILAVYASGGSLQSPNYNLLVGQTNIINVEFTTDASSQTGSIYGAAIYGNASGDYWNFCDGNSDYLSGGVALKDAGSNAVNTRFYAYLGPCVTPFILPPHPPGTDPGGWERVCVTYSNSDTVSYPGYLVTNTIPCRPINGVDCNVITIQITNQPGMVVDGTNTVTICTTSPFIPSQMYFSGWSQSDFLNSYNAYDKPDWAHIFAIEQGRADSDTDYGVANYIFFQDWYWPLVSQFGLYMGVSPLYPTINDPYDFYYDDNWDPTGPYFSLGVNDQNELSYAFGEATAYKNTLDTYMSSQGWLGTQTNLAPCGLFNCYIPPFDNVTHSGNTLSGNDGASWLCPGSSDTIAGGWFKHFYPQAKRTLVFYDVPPGKYGVYVYFDSPLAVAPANINGTSATTMQTSAGVKYWYANAKTKVFPKAGNYSQGALAAAPIWLANNLYSTNQYSAIEIDVDSPTVFGTNSEVKILGLQLVKLETSSSQTVLDVLPGTGAAYLNWNISYAATNYQIFRAISSTNSWTLLGSTTNISYQDTNLNIGLTYFYKVLPVDPGNVLEPASDPVSVVPFGCPNPLPPLIDYVSPLQISVVNGTYSINYQTLLTNSDALDPQGYPLVFKVDGVMSGSLMINGSPFSGANNTIGTNDTAVWSPPAVMTSPGTACFRVYVYDGFNRSEKTINVVIKQHPKAYLHGWGDNEFGEVGIGLIPEPTDSDRVYYDVLNDQATNGVLSRDPRWAYYDTNEFGLEGPILYTVMAPDGVLDIDNVASLFSDYYGTAAVTADGQLWEWGYGEALEYGLSLVYQGNGQASPTDPVNWEQINPQDYQNLMSYPLYVPSPTSIQQLGGSSILATGVRSECGNFLTRIILKDDGTLWSWGIAGVTLGRDPQSQSELFTDAYNAHYGIIPGRIEIDGNNSSELIPGRQFVEVHSEPYETAAVARCQDGSVWWWGYFSGVITPGPNDWNFYLAGNDGIPWQPKRLTCLDIPGAAPIYQMSLAGNHLIILRSDGSVSEMGYIPSLDPNAVAGQTGLSGGSGTTDELAAMYTANPLAITDLPQNINQVCAASTYDAALTDDGNVWIWGHMGDTNNVSARQIKSLKNIVKIAINYYCILALDRNGILWAWGYNGCALDRGNFDSFFGIPGDGTFYSTAVRVQGIENVTDVYCGVQTAFAIGTDVQGKPVGLTATSMNQAIGLSWSNYPAATSYNIYRSLDESGGYVVIGTSTANAYIDQNPPLQNGTTYYYQVTAVVNGVETMPSWDVAGVPMPMPQPVQNLTAVDECHAIDLFWDPPANASQSPPVEYQVDRAGTVNGTYLTVAHCQANASSYEDDNVTAGQTYYYQVVSVNSAGMSSANTIVSGAIDTNTCAESPTISTNWMANSWFSVSAPPLPNAADQNCYAMLYWTGPADGDWLYWEGDITTNNFIGSFLYNMDYYNQNSPMSDNIYMFLWNHYSVADSNIMADANASLDQQESVTINLFNQLITSGVNITNYDPNVFYPSRVATLALMAQNPSGTNLVKLNRMILDDTLLANSAGFMTGPSWGTNLTGFRIYYRYVLPNGGMTPLYSQDISLNAAETNAYSKRLGANYYNDQAYCYGFRWPVLAGAKYWASVSAIVGDQAGGASIEAGPMASANDTTSAFSEIVPRAVPGYHQVYLDWPDDVSILNYDIKCTALTPWSTPNQNYYIDSVNEPEAWVVLGTNLTDARYWHTDLSPTNFTPVDFKYVADFLNVLTNAIDPVSSNVWKNVSPSAKSALINFQNTDNVMAARTNLASELTRIIQSGSLIFTTNQADMAAADLSANTLTLLGRLQTSPPLSSADSATLNRLLLEDAYVHYLARYETPSPVGFVSGDFVEADGGVQGIVYQRLSNDGSFPTTDPVGSVLWNWMTPAARSQVTNYVTSGYTSPNDLAMQRLLASEFTRIIQTNAILFSTNEVIAANATPSSRVMELFGRQGSLSTNEVYLLNRLLIENAWTEAGPGNYLEPLSDLRYYWVDANYCDGLYPEPSYWVGARPDDLASAPPTLSFSAQAFPYDSMVSLQWNIPGVTNQIMGSDTSWQFSVERQDNSGNPFATISQSGFGLGYLDSDAVNGTAYQYRIDAYDTNYNLYQAVTAWVTPTNSASLTLFTPQPGSTYVDLAWTPIRANQFTVNRGTSPNGPFTAVASLIGANAYENAPNTYRDIGLQNGVTYYYWISALTPTGYEMDSAVQSTTPLATLTLLPPDHFQGQFLPDDDNGRVLLTWTPRSGAKSYQLFLRDQTRLTPLDGYNGINPSFAYEIPDGTEPNTTFTFDVRAVNAQGVAGDLTETTATNVTISDSVDTTQPVVLQVAGSLTNISIMAPTNLDLRATVNVPDVQEVSFYDNGQLIGTVGSAPFQMTWSQVPAGSHAITAAASVQPENFFGGTAQTFSTAHPLQVNVTVAPELSAYQTSATDLQLPAPALPISLSRSYTSRNTDTNGILGVGWSAEWNVGTVKLSVPLNSNWQGIYQSSIGGGYFISENVAHYATVTLPGGASIGFEPQLKIDHSPMPANTAPYAENEDEVDFSYSSFVIGQGSLTMANTEMPFINDYDSDSWNNPLSFGSFDPGQFVYTGPDGTAYLFAKQGADNLTWLLTKTTDRGGNSLTYTYDSSQNLQCISNSCGRAVNFTYTSPQTGVTNISVYDSIGGLPVVVYVVSNNLLTEVHQLVNRSGGYQTNLYTYGSDAVNAPQDYNRITDVYDTRGVRVLHNAYTNATTGATFNGDVAIQISPGRTNTFQVDPATYNLTVTTMSSTSTNTAVVTSDQSGAISGATQPASGTNASSTLTTQCSYDSNGNLISQTDANGNTKTYTYDDQNRLVGQSDANGNSTSVTLDDYGQPEISTDANGQQTWNEYDNAGNPINVRDPSGTSTSYTYSQPVTDGNGNVSVGELQTSQSQTAPFVPYTIVTTNNYNTTSLIKGDLLSTTEEWVDGSGNAVGKTVTTSYTYDADGNRLTETKTRTVNGGIQTNTTAYTYDAMNRVIMTVVSATGAETLAPQTNVVTYNSLGKQFTSTDAVGRTTTNIYDFNGNQIETEYPDGTVSRTVYDALGHQLYVQDRSVPVSGVTTAPATYNIYDASGRVIQTGRSANVQLTKSSETSGSDFVALDPSLSQFKMTVSSAGTALTTNLTFYDAAGNVQYSVDGRGAVTQYQYDAGGRRTNVLVYTAYTFTLSGTNTPNPTGASQGTVYTYDPNGNQLTATDAKGNTTTSHYDAANRLIQTDEPATSGTVSRYTYYDGLGRKIQETDEAGVSTAYSYDFRGLLTSVTLAFGTTQAVTTVYNYDEWGNEIGQIDANGHSTTFQYDALGRRIGRTLPGNQSESFAYDLAGNQIYQTNFNGVIITNQYDLDNRLTNCSAPGYRVAYAYSATGLRTNMTDASGTTAYFYDNLSELTNKTVTWSGQSPVSLNYRYDALGSLTNLWSSTANGVSNSYQLDLLGRITNVLANGSMVAGYGFDAVGNLQTIRYANGVTNLYQYDAMNRLTNLVWKSSGTTLGSFAYTVSSTGNRTALAETVNGTSRTCNWSYDYLYRLTGESIQNAGTVSYQYDGVGNRTNRTSSIAGLANQSPTFTANDWLTGDGYDLNGNTTNSAGVGYGYDVMNHLTNVNSGQVVVTYDGDGNRVKKVVGGVTTYYLVDDRNPSGYAQVMEEYQGASLSRVYNYGLALVSQRQVSSGTVSYYGMDGHGSTRFLLNAAGGITDSYTYDAYGLIIATSGSTPNNYLYCGQQYDGDVGMYYLRARYYKPDTGRFWTFDSYEGNTEDPLSLHKYLYCKANPINGIDPSGHGEDVDVLAGSSLGAAIDAQVMPVLSRVYMTTFNTLMKVAMNQQQILFYANATLAATTALAVGADVMDRVAQRLLKNTAPIPAGNFSYGKALEQTALQDEDGYLGGNVSKIDYFDKNSGLAISFKTHGLSSSAPNLNDRLLASIQRDLQKMSDVKVAGARGIAASGLNVNIAGNQIKQTVLAVAVPESQAETVLSSTFQQVLVQYEQFYETEVEVIPVQGWSR